MGRAVVRVLHEMPECSISGGTEPDGSALVGADIGELAGVGKLGIPVTTTRSNCSSAPRASSTLRRRLRRPNMPASPPRRASCM